MKHFLDHLFSKMISQPPSGGCVLKLHQFEDLVCQFRQPPSGGCVLKLVFLSSGIEAASSRLQAAVC